MTRFFVRFPVTTWMIFLVFVVLGIYSIPRLKIEAIPDVNLPTLTITSGWNGASPQAVQRSISIPIEDAMQEVHGVEKVESTSRAGSATSHALVPAQREHRLRASRGERAPGRRAAQPSPGRHPAADPALRTRRVPD